jgi:uncharacterized protein involved in outer membrane biogenesis
MTGRRRLKIVLGVVGAVVLLAGVVASLRLEALVNGLKDRQLAELSRTLGRPVRAGRVVTHLLTLSVDLHDLSIGADPTRPAETLPVLSLRHLHLSVAGRTLWSLGKRPGVKELLIEGLTVNVIRHADGTLNVLNLKDALPQRPPEPPRPLDPGTRDRIEHATLDRFRLLDGRVRFVDLGRGGAEVDVSHLEIAADGAGLSRPSTVTVRAALLAPAPNFTLTAALAPGTVEAPPPLDRLTVSWARTDLSPLAPFLTAAMPDGLGGLQSATLAVDLDLRPGSAVPGGKGVPLVRGHLAVSGLRFQGGEAVDLSMESDITGDAAGVVDVRRFALTVGSMGLEAHGKLEALASAPRFTDVVLASHGLDFDRVRRFLPDLDHRAGAVLHGPFSVSARAGGSAAAQRFEAMVDFAPASIEIPGLFRKPADVPLGVELRGQAQADACDLERLALSVADWRLAAHGTVRRLRTPLPELALTAATEAPGLGGVLRLLPPVAAGLRPHSRIDANLTVSAQVAGTRDALHAELDARLSKLAVKAPDARLGGGGFVTARADRKGQALDAKIKADFTTLEATYADLIRKAAGVPLALEMVVGQAGGHQQVHLDVRAAGLVASGQGELRPADARGSGEPFTGSVVIEPFRVRSLTAMLPTLATSGIGDIRAGARVELHGRAGQPTTIEATVQNLTLVAGKSDVHGKLALVNPEAPRVEADIQASYLDLDDFLPPAPKSTAAREGKPARTRKDDRALARTSGRIGLVVARGRAAGIDYQDLRADLRLDGGRAVARTLEVGVFGGHFSGSGTELALLDDEQPFKTKGSLRNIDLGMMIGHFTGVSDLVGGRLDATVGLAGAGTTKTLLERTLAGALDGSVKELRLMGGHLVEALLDPVAARVNALPGGSKLIDPEALGKMTDRAVSDLQASVAFDKGALTFARPLTIDTAGGPLRLDGRVLLAGRWDMAGLLTLSPRAASALTGNRLGIGQPLPVKLTVTGPIARPRIEPAALDEVVRIYATALARSSLAAGARAAASQVSPGASAAAEHARDLAEDSRRQAAEAAAKAQEEARARAEETKKSAAEAAKDKLKGLLGR